MWLVLIRKLARVSQDKTNSHTYKNIIISYFDFPAENLDRNNRPTFGKYCKLLSKLQKSILCIPNSSHSEKKFWPKWSTHHTRCTEASDANFAKRPSIIRNSRNWRCTTIRFMIARNEQQFCWKNHFFWRTAFPSWDQKPGMWSSRSHIHPQRVTVWYGFWSDSIIGLYFFENAAGNATSVKGQHYRCIINDCMWPEIVAMELDDFWFQHSFISRFGGVNCPPRFDAIRPFLWDEG